MADVTFCTNLQVKYSILIGWTQTFEFGKELIDLVLELLFILLELESILFNSSVFRENDLESC